MISAEDQIAELVTLKKKLYHQGKYQEALVPAKRLAILSKDFFGEDHPDYAEALNDLATCYVYLAEYKHAEPLFEQSLCIVKKKLGEAHPDYALILTNLASLYIYTMKKKKAEQLLIQAMEIYKKILREKTPDYARILKMMAILNHMSGRSDKCESLYLEAMEITKKNLGKDHPEYANILNSLAYFYTSIGFHEKAIRLYRQASHIIIKNQGVDHPEYAALISNLAILLYLKREYKKAEPLFTQSLEILKKALGEDNSDRANILIYLAYLYIYTNRMDMGIKCIKEAVTIQDRVMGHIFSISSEVQRLDYLSSIRPPLDTLISLVSRNFDHSPKDVQDIFSIILKRKAITSEAFAIQRDTVLGGKYPHLHEKLRLLNNIRMQISREKYANAGKELLGFDQKVLSKLHTEKESLEEELSRHIPEMQMEQSIRKADMELVAKSLPDKSILIEFFRYRVFNFNAVPYSQWSESHYCAFVLSSCQLENIKFIDLGNADMIDRLIASYKLKIMGNQQKQSSLEIMERDLHDSIERVSQLLEGNAPNERRRSRLVQVDISDRIQSDMGINKGMQLYYGLFAPIKEAFSDCSHLIIAPDSQLNMIPFEVIPIPEGGYLVDKYRISYVGVGRDVLPFSKQKPGKPEKPMVIASPDFDLSAEEKLSQSENSPSTRRFSENFTNEFSKFYPLPGTKLEGEYIGKLLGIKPLLEKEALEARIKSVSSPQILHIATHGFFFPNDTERRSLEDPPGIRDQILMGMPLPDESKENPMLLSGFVLAGVNTWLKNGALPPEAEDGIVTAEDVTGLDLTNTDLVVLSACETGIGEVKVAEGVFGLRRAFTLAGAKTLIMSLWKVNDICTQELMEDFYRRILAGTPKADALRNAQIKLREKYPHPRDWGAFICQGDPGPLSMDNNPQ